MLIWELCVGVRGRGARGGGGQGPSLLALAKGSLGSFKDFASPHRGS